MTITDKQAHEILKRDKLDQKKIKALSLLTVRNKRKSKIKIKHWQETTAKHITLDSK